MTSEDGRPEELRVVLLGETGSGKSATGNTILGKRAFTIRQPHVPETLTCQTERGEFEGTPVVVVDTPWSIRPNTTEMSKCISYCAPGPHAFLDVIPIKRITNVEQHVERHVKILQWLFGEEASRYTTVLFTHGDELPDGVTAEEFIHQHPVPFGVGYHVFNNRDEDPSQVRELLKKINTMVQRNGGSYCIKVKDWKDKYLYPFASAVTIGVGIGAASGGTGGGVLVAFVGSVVGVYAPGVGGNRAVAGAVAVAVVGAVVGTVAVAVAGVVAVAGYRAKALAIIIAVVVAPAVALPAVGAGAGAGHVARVGAVILAAFVALAVAVAAAVDLADTFRAVVVIGTGIAAKATAAIFAGAGAARAFKVLDDIGVYADAIFGSFGGAAVGAGVSAAVGAHAGVDFLGGGFAAFIGVIMVLLALLMDVREAASAIDKIVRFAIVAGVSVGTAFGAAVGVLGVSDFAAGTMIYIICQAVTWWLNKTA